ncbi:unnamed protein product, partial [Didymodactylos carnosus]
DLYDEEDSRTVRQSKRLKMINTVTSAKILSRTIVVPIKRKISTKVSKAITNGNIMKFNKSNKTSTKSEMIPPAENEPTWKQDLNLQLASTELNKTGMKLGYPCINTSLCTPNHTFRLAALTDEKCYEISEQNIHCLTEILKYNIGNGYRFFRIGSQTIPFASHKQCTANWSLKFADKLRMIGQLIRDNNMRISMHPDQFVLINALSDDIVKRSIDELTYHCTLLDCMELNSTAKVQIHVGGIYGDKLAAMDRFIENYKFKLTDQIRKRMVIENDDHLFSVKDCLYIHKHTNIPILFDNLHHDCLNNNESMLDAMQACFNTWNSEHDGVPMIDYSTQQTGKRIGAHISHIDEKHFQNFINETKDLHFDIMLEIKDKEQSAILALAHASKIRANFNINADDYRYIYENAQKKKITAEEQKQMRQQLREAKKEQQLQKEKNQTKNELKKKKRKQSNITSDDDGDDQQTDDLFHTGASDVAIKTKIKKRKTK